jgi:macrophage erythroblast attacher
LACWHFTTRSLTQYALPFRPFIQLKDTRAEETLYSQRTKVRLQHLQEFTTIPTLDSDDFARWSRVRLNRILIDYMLRDGFRETATLLAKSEHIEVSATAGLVELCLGSYAVTFLHCN